MRWHWRAWALVAAVVAGCGNSSAGTVIGGETVDAEAGADVGSADGVTLDPDGGASSDLGLAEAASTEVGQQDTGSATDTMLPVDTSAVKAKLVMEPTSHNFGSLRMFDVSEPFVFTLKNQGGSPADLMPAALVLNSVTVTVTDFRIMTSTCGQTLVPGASCQTTIVFEPVHGGGHQNALAFTPPGIGRVYGQMSGGAKLAIEAMASEYSNSTNCRTGYGAVYHLTNRSIRPMNGHSFNVCVYGVGGGSHNDDSGCLRSCLSIKSDNCPSVLSPGESCDVEFCQDQRLCLIEPAGAIILESEGFVWGL